MADCQHTQIRTWFFDDTRESAGMWSCVSCGTKFEPVNVERDADAERYRWLRREQVALSLSHSTIAALVADQSELDAARKDAP